MTALPESKFPTIADLRDRLTGLVENGLGELPIQILVVPDSTLQAIARNAGHGDDRKPALMIDLMGEDGSSVTIMSTDRMSGAPAPRLAIQ